MKLQKASDIEKELRSKISKLEDRFKSIEEDNARLQSQLQEKHDVELRQENIQVELQEETTHTKMILEALEPI